MSLFDDAYEAFMESSTYGKPGDSMWVGDDGDAIFSYNTCIVAWCPSEDNCIINITPYSITTAKYQKAFYEKWHEAEWAKRADHTFPMVENVPWHAKRAVLIAMYKDPSAGQMELAL